MEAEFIINCEVCFIEDIKNEKKNNIKSNIKYLEEISNKIKEIIYNLKIKYEKISENKEALKINIQREFTKIRNALIKREDELLLEVDIQFNNIYFDEKIIEQSEKLPKQVNLTLEKSKFLDYNDNKLAFFINECINIENLIKDTNKIKVCVEKSKSKDNTEIKFYFEEQFNLLLQNINNFSKIFLVNKNLNFDSLILTDNDATKKNQYLI